MCDVIKIPLKIKLKEKLERKPLKKRYHPSYLDVFYYVTHDTFKRFDFRLMDLAKLGTGDILGEQSEIPLRTRRVYKVMF